MIRDYLLAVAIFGGLMYLLGRFVFKK